MGRKSAAILAAEALEAEEAALRECMDFMKLDYASEDDKSTVRRLMAAAAEYLSNAGIPAPETGQPGDLYTLALWSLTLHYYDHRDAVGNETALPTGLRPVLNQLKLINSIIRRTI